MAELKERAKSEGLHLVTLFSTGSSVAELKVHLPPRANNRESKPFSTGSSVAELKDAEKVANAAEAEWAFSTGSSVAELKAFVLANVFSRLTTFSTGSSVAELKETRLGTARPKVMDVLHGIIRGRIEGDKRWGIG